MGRPTLMLSVVVWERFSPRLFILWVRLCAVAFIEGVLPHSSTYPFKLDIVAFMFQVAPRSEQMQCSSGWSTCWNYHVPYSPFLQCSNPLPICPDFLFRGLYVQSLLQAVLKPYGYFVVVLVLLAGEVRTIIIHFIDDQPIINRLVHHMLKTAQVLSRRPCHLALISVCFVCWFVLRQGQALDPALPMWDHRHTDPYSVW